MHATLEHPHARTALVPNQPRIAHPSLADLMENSGTLPSIPRIVAQVLKELDAEDPNPRSIVMLVSTDPALTAKIIALANSPLFSTGRSIGSLNEAVSVLGFSHVRAMVTTAALASSFKSVPEFNLEEFWHYCLNAALVAKALGRNFRINEGAAFTAGLVHAIGELILHLGAKSSMELLHDTPFLSFERSSKEQELLGYNHADVSAAFIDQWDFPQNLVHALGVYALQVGHGHAAQKDHDPMAAMLHLAAWRARCQILGLDEDKMRENFPASAATELGLNLSDVLEKDPAEWTSSAQVAMFVGK